METLEIELSYIQQLIDDEVIQAFHQYYNWDRLEDCALLYNLDVSDIDTPSETVSRLINRKADEYLSEHQAERFKAVWQQLERHEQLHIALRIFESA
jgi:hypothetical protein